VADMVGLDDITMTEEIDSEINDYDFVNEEKKA
jgi:hypothetical protein